MTAPQRHADLATQWLLSNGLGGFAMGTTAGVNRHRYHGLLIAAAFPPVGRVLALHSTIDEILLADGRVVALSTQAFGDDQILHPDGCSRLENTERSGHRAWQWTWNLGEGVSIIRELTLHQGRNRATLRWLATGLNEPATLRVRPLTPLRDFHSLDHESAAIYDVQPAGGDGGVIVSRDRMKLQLRTSGRITIDGQWWRRFAYEEDRRRGQDWLEDVYSPVRIEAQLDSSNGWTLELEAELIEPAVEIGDAAEATSRFQKRFETAGSAAVLEQAADAFVVKRLMTPPGASNPQAFTTIIAGYPWFGDWGRDSMISLPGLLLATGRLDEARSMLMLFARHERDGLIPNHFDDYGGEPEYNTVDASLWFIHAVAELAAAGGKPDRELLDAVQAILAAYQHGAPFHIRMERDGLIAAGDATTQLTWMDAKRDGVAFTPRHGKAVEINALWHHALSAVSSMSSFSDAVRHNAADLAGMVANAFRNAFWWRERGCLHDVLTPNSRGGFQPDGCLRPNQLLAVSLAPSPLSKTQQQSVVRIVGDRLLTPFGLRTLDPADPAYKPRYEGDFWQRDAAYHQGTVWPWLIGPYVEAVLRAGDFDAESRREARTAMQPLLREMLDPSFEGRGVLGQIAEIYDADPPHRPAGCLAQAWSVAELLRAWRLVEG